MDDTDRRIYRALTRDKAFFWASLDPRVSAEDVARRLKLAPATVRARLKAWRKEEFLTRMEVMPHPAHLGLVLGSGNIRVDDPRAKPGVIDALGLVPGALACLDHLNDEMAFNVLAESDRGLERVRRLAAKLPGVDEVSPCRPMMPESPGPSLSHLDWNVVRALREKPDATLKTIATHVGITEKTLRKRYGALVERNAVLFVPVLDLEKVQGTLTRIIVGLDREEDRARVTAMLRTLPLFADVFDVRRLMPSGPSILEAWMHHPNPVAAARDHREVLASPGVASADLVIPTRSAFFTGWLDEAIEVRRTASLGAAR